MGGVVIGALIGIGALLVLPKLANVLGGGGGYGGSYGGNYRSKQICYLFKRSKSESKTNWLIEFVFFFNLAGVDGSDPTGITEMLAKLDEILGKNNIDSTVCMQRTVCSYIRQSAYHNSMGTADQTDNIITALSG